MQRRIENIEAHKTTKDELKVHSVLPLSRLNGPGKRLVVFFQGCKRGCAGCFNPGTHDGTHDAHAETEASGLVYNPKALLKEYVIAETEGITISGGEPMEQPEGLLSLLKEARVAYGLSTVVYSGFTIEKIKARRSMALTLKHIDALIDGAFVEELKEPTLLARGSTNQRIHLLTRRFSEDDFIMPGKSEITIRKDGSAIVTGFSRIVIPHA